MKYIKASVFAVVVSLSSMAMGADLNTSSQDSLDYKFRFMPIDMLHQQAIQGNEQAQFHLARRFHKGEGVAVDADKAIKWYTSAAKQGAVPAELNLGLMYALGEAVKVDEVQARFWLEQAAQHGDNRASFTLAMIDEKQQKLVDAYKWYDLSTRDGMLDDRVRNKARGKIYKLAMNLSSQDISDARRQADAWLFNQ